MQAFSAFILDLRHAITALRRAPSFTLAAVATLALAIGANTAVFSVVNAILIRPLPYAESSRVVGVWSFWDGTDKGRVSPGEYFDYLRDTTVFDEFGIFGTASVTFTEPGADAERLDAGYVTFGVMRALGASPLAGTTFSREHDIADSDPTAIVGEDLWRRRFAADPNIVGRRITIDGRTTRIIAVLPHSFVLPHEFDAAEKAQIYLPLAFPPEQASVRGNHSFLAVARMRQGVDLERASADIARVAASFVSALPGEYPASRRFSARAVPIQDDVNGEIRQSLLLMLGAIGLLLLIACTNVASLVLVRTDVMQRGAAIRTALGASTARLVGYAVSESFVVCACAGGIGIGLAKFGIDALQALGTRNMPRLADVSVDGMVVAYAVIATAAVSALVALLPVFRVTRGTAGSGVASTRATSSKSQVRQLLVGAQVALTLVLLLSATLLTSSFVKLLSVDPGYSTERVVAIDLTLPDTTYPDGARTTALFARLIDSVENQSGVVAAGAVANLPLAAGDGDINIQIEGRETLSGTPSRRANWQVVTPGYFETMQMRLRSGRTIEKTDIAGAMGVVVISDSMAKQDRPDTSAIGARFRLGGGAGPGMVNVIGVVPDVRHNSLAEGPERQMYLAHAQFRFWGGGMAPARSMTIVVRAESSPESIGGAIRREVRALDPALPLGDIRTMDEVRADSVAGPRFLTTVLSAFSMAALIVALVGVYGVVSYAVAGRRREIGVRLAVGGTPGAIVGLMVRQGMMPCLAGIAVGVSAGIPLSVMLDTLLFEVSPRDPIATAGVSAAIAIVTFVACYVPARRAGATSPAVVLHPE